MIAAPIIYRAGSTSDHLYSRIIGERAILFLNTALRSDEQGRHNEKPCEPSSPHLNTSGKLIVVPVQGSHVSTHNRSGTFRTSQGELTARPTNVCRCRSNSSSRWLPTKLGRDLVQLIAMRTPGSQQAASRPNHVAAGYRRIGNMP